VEIDSNKQDREHVPTFSIEATIFDNSDMSVANVVNLKSKPNPKGGPCHGFHGYVLGGKMQNPKLWSSEKVRDLILGKFHKMLLLQLNCYIL
jgi:beta-galactosidase